MIDMYNMIVIYQIYQDFNKFWLIVICRTTDPAYTSLVLPLWQECRMLLMQLFGMCLCYISRTKVLKAVYMAKEKKIFPLSNNMDNYKIQDRHQQIATDRNVEVVTKSSVTGMPR